MIHLLTCPLILVPSTSCSLWMTSSLSVILLKGDAQEDPLFQKWPEQHLVLPVENVKPLYISLLVLELMLRGVCTG